jgi:predicted MFS family arabinose efflux permease
MRFSPAAYVKSHVPPPGHQRTFLLGNTIGMMVNGVFLPIYVIYDTKIVGISTSKTALAIAIAALIGLPVTLLAGDLADRVGPRRMVLFALSGLTLGMASYVFIQGFWSLLAVVASMNVFAYSYLASEGALMRRIGGDDTVTFRSQVQSLGNIAVTVGLAAAGICIWIGTHWAYRVMFLVVAAGYLAVLLITLKIPDYQPLPRPERAVRAKAPRLIVLRDEAFIAYALVTAGLAMSGFVDNQLLPIWIVGFTRAPHWTIALVFLVNTGISAVLQMPLSKNIRSPRQAGWAMLRGSVVLLLAFLVLAAMPGHSPWLATVLVIAGVALMAVAQIWLISGRFVLEFSLPPAHAQGQYDGFLNMVMTMGITAAPLLLIAVVAYRGTAGWAGLGALFVMFGLMGPGIAAWGERTRPQAAAAEQAATEPDADTIEADAGMEISQ